jgi:C1A family cysteine protease
LEERILRGSQLPAKFDLWPHVPPIWDQGQLGSCTAHGSLRAFVTEAMRQGITLPKAPAGGAPLSRLAQYFWTRDLEGTTSYDAGGTVRDAIKVLATSGAAPESEWPYTISRFTSPPSQQATSDATQHMAVKYQSVKVGGPGAPIRTALAQGVAVTFGFSVPQSFQDGSWDAATEVLELPGPNESFVGGHCVALTGYDFSCTDFPAPFFWADNSWGTSWGQKGRFRMHFDWFDPARGLADDLWVVQATT